MFKLTNINSSKMHCMRLIMYHKWIFIIFQHDNQNCKEYGDMITPPQGEGSNDAITSSWTSPKTRNLLIK